VSWPDGELGTRRRFATADVLLLVGALLLFVDSFLYWERVCVSILRLTPICVNLWTAWSGRGALAGVAMAVMSVLVVVEQTIVLASPFVPSRGRLMRAIEPRDGDVVLVAALGTGTVAFGALKLAFVVADHSTYGSYVGFVLLLVIAAGTLLKLAGSRTR
jgi:hypothetical protein